MKWPFEIVTPFYIFKKKKKKKTLLSASREQRKLFYRNKYAKLNKIYEFIVFSSVRNSLSGARKVDYVI